MLPSANRKLLTRSIGLLVGLGILLGLIWHVGFEDFFDIVLKTSPYWLFLSILVYAIGWFFRTWRLERLTYSAGFSLPMRYLFRIHIGGFALNTIMPAKLGDAAMVCNLGMKGIGYGRAAAIIFQSRILDLAAICLLFIPTFALKADDILPQWVYAGFILSSVIVAIPIVIVLADRSMLLLRVLDWLSARGKWPLLKVLIKSVGHAYASYHEMLANRSALIVSVILSLIIWIIEALTCQLIAMAIGSPISFTLASLAICVGNLCKGVPSTPGSVGVYEFAFSAVLVLLGQPTEAAVVIAILDHLVKKGFNVVIGFSSMGGFGMSIRKLIQTAQERKDLLAQGASPVPPTT